MIGLVLGISVGVGWASLREFLDDAVHKSDRLTLTTGFPVLADIPEIITPRDRFRKRIKRIALATCAAGVIEQFSNSSATAGAARQVSAVMRVT